MNHSGQQVNIVVTVFFLLQSAFFLLFKARLSQIEGKLSEAIVSFSKCIKVQDQWKQVHNMCRWELLWCHV